MYNCSAAGVSQVDDPTMTPNPFGRPAPAASSVQQRCYNETHVQNFEFWGSDHCTNDPINFNPTPTLITLPGCNAFADGSGSFFGTCSREGGYIIRGSTYSTFYEYEYAFDKFGGSNSPCFPTGSDVFTYDNLYPSASGCYPYLNDPTNVSSINSISWTCDAQMTTYIDSSGSSCATNLVRSWSATASPLSSPPSFPPPRTDGPRPVIAYSSPYDGSECVRQTEIGRRYQNEYLTSQCPYTPPVAAAPLTPGAITAIVIACIGSIAIAAFAAICVLQAQRTLVIRKQRAKAARSTTMTPMKAVTVTGF